MQKLERNINMGFRVNSEERDLIRRRMAEAQISNLRAFLLKMALTGYILHLDLTTVNECARLLRNTSNNINQIAARVNSTENIYAADIADIQQQLGEIWEHQNKTIKSLAKILEVV